MNAHTTQRMTPQQCDDALLTLMAADCGLKIPKPKPPHHWTSRPRFLTPRQHKCLGQIRDTPRLASEVAELLDEPHMQNAISCCLRKLCSDKEPCVTRELIEAPYKGGTHQWLYSITAAGLIRLAKHEATL